MRLIKNNKGLSPVIATVLLISLGIVLAGILLLWMTGFVSEQLSKQQKPIDQVCSEVKFDTSYEYNPVSRSFTLQVVNRGNVNLYGFNIKFIGEGGSNMKSFQFNVPIGESSDVQIIQVIGDNVNEAILYPMLLGSVKGKKLTKPATCLDAGKSIKF